MEFFIPLAGAATIFGAQMLITAKGANMEFIWNSESVAQFFMLCILILAEIIAVGGLVCYFIDLLDNRKGRPHAGHRR